MNFLQSTFILLTVTIGFFIYIKIAFRAQTGKIEKFFLAGRNIGQSLFINASWGTNFAFANSIFYAFWLTYTIGLVALWVQTLWAVGICLYALILPKLIRHTEHYTLHGYLGSLFGSKTRVMASIVSMTGLLICLGFEISFVSMFLAQVLGLKDFQFLVVALFAGFIATFCSIGGFQANVITDKISNRIMIVGMLILLVLSFLHNNFEWSMLQAGTLWKSFSDTSNTSVGLLLGLAFFSLYNFIDMTNWQNISANSLKDNEIRHTRIMQFALVKSALRFLAMPVFIGSMIGYFLRTMMPGITDQSVFMSQVVSGLMPHIPIFAALILGFLTFGFLASSLAGADSWLMASVQTLSWDLVDYKKFKRANFKAVAMDAGLHERVTKRAKYMLLILGFGGTMIVYGISVFWGDIFSLQFIIFGAGLSMIPSLLYGLLIHEKWPQQFDLSYIAFFSILTGYTVSVLIFIISAVYKNGDIVNWVPVEALGCSLGIFWLGYALKYAEHFHKNMSRRPK